MGYKAVYFDMDGTVLDTLGDLVNAVNHTMRHFGCPEREWSFLRRVLGAGARNLIERSLPEGTSAEMFAEVFAYYKPWYREHSRILTKPFEGIPELLRELETEGVQTAVISNKPDPAVRELGEIFFPGICCVGERSGIPIKPDPAAILAVAKEQGVSPEDLIYVGDTEYDILAARRAGIESVIVTYGFRDRLWLEDQGAAHIVDTVPELREMLLSLCNI